MTDAMTNSPEKPEAPRKHKPFVLSLIGLVLLIVIGLVAIVAFILRHPRAILARLGLCSKRATVEDLKFPVILIHPDHSAPFVGIDVDDLRKGRRPMEGTTIIDSDFKLYTQKNIKCRRQGDIKLIANFLFNHKSPLAYSFDLKRCKKSGIEAARERLAACAIVAGGTDPDARGAQINREATLAGIIAVIESSTSQPVI